tara:strand:+ start:1401 stop:2384 length:984 start_codon:yes stop_codon:yes gene_type:complete
MPTELTRRAVRWRAQVFLVILSLIFFATFIYFLEGPKVGSRYDTHRQQWVRADGSSTPFESISFSMWWCLVTMTTVGYGDSYPITLGGQILGIVIMFWGLVVLSLPITIVGANFDEEYREMKRREKEAAAHKDMERDREREKERELARSSAGSSNDGLGEEPSSGSTPQKTPGGLLARSSGLMMGRGSRVKEDGFVYPTKRIARLMQQSNADLIKRVHMLMIKHERELRREIRKVMVAHGEGCDQPTPLERSIDKLMEIAGPDSGEPSSLAAEDQSIGNLLQQIRSANEALEPEAVEEPASPSGAATAVVPLPAQPQPESSQAVTSY